MVRLLMFKLAEVYLKLKWYVLGGYYSRLIVQAEYLYRQSPLFRYRWQEMGLEFAEKSFKDDTVYFFHKAKQERVWIRMRIFADAIMNRPPRPYYMAKDD